MVILVKGYQTTGVCYEKINDYLQAVLYYQIAEDLVIRVKMDNESLNFNGLCMDDFNKIKILNKIQNEKLDIPDKNIQNFFKM
jgi:hypothetical protein